MDTTGTVWPERQRLLHEYGFAVNETDIRNERSFGMNWKMTAKTILVQMHHKSEMFEKLNKHFVLVIQEPFYEYIKQEFSFSHIQGVRIGYPIHIHSYSFKETDNSLRLSLDTRVSTDFIGISQCLGLRTQVNVKLEEIIARLQEKLNDEYRLVVG